VKNAPAVTARRATNQIVLVAEHQALAAIAAATPAVIAAAALAAIVLAVIVLAEQTVRVVTMRPIDRVVTATGHTHHARLVTEIRVLAGKATIVLVIRVATAIPLPGRLARLETAHTQLDPHVMEIVRIRLDPHVTAILRVGHRAPVATAPTRRVLLATVSLGHREPVASVLTRLVLLAMVTHVRVVMAMTAHVSRGATAIRAAGPHVVMVILRVGLRVPGETVPLRRARRATARVLIVHAPIAQIVHAPIVLTAISRAENGSPTGEIVVRSARR
jgi:hypothetical protein